MGGRAGPWVAAVAARSQMSPRILSSLVCNSWTYDDLSTYDDYLGLCAQMYASLVALGLTDACLHRDEIVIRAIWAYVLYETHKPASLQAFVRF